MSNDTRLLTDDLQIKVHSVNKIHSQDNNNKKLKPRSKLGCTTGTGVVAEMMNGSCSRLASLEGECEVCAKWNIFNLE